LATRVLANALAVDGLSLAEVGILLVFSLTFAWLSYGFWTSLAGFFVTLARRPLHQLAPPAQDLASQARTALLVPVYHEDPHRVATRLRAIVRSLADTGQLDRFDVFILSDSRQRDCLREEEAVWAQLCREPLTAGRVFYRNRPDNVGRKAGNIADFCRRWGRQYSYFVILDADSVMTGDTLVKLVGLMEANPHAGLLQTLPHPVRGETLFARALQFAARLYGPVYAAGLSYWYPGRSNYWGHNAIIRCEAFMGAAGLPTLSGRPPLGGEILSHDFVEAALLQRAGWSVWMVPELDGSYEELPANLRGYLARDQRWCQGNLQHVRLLTAKGLTPVSRLHLGLGAMSYIVSLMWLLLLVLTTAEVARVRLWPEARIPEVSLLFQPWPVVDPRQLLALAGVTAAMLFLPKLLPLLLALCDGERRRSFGGGLRLLRSTVAEVGFAMLLAPVLMLQHSKAVVVILLGRSVSWNGQQRDGESERWGAMAALFGATTAIGCLWALAAGLLAPGLLLWLSPIVAGLLAAIPLAVLSSRVDLGLAARRRGWLATPEELAPPPELAGLPASEQRSAPGRRARLAKVRPAGAW
jgi:membrane glycosyltransferase